MKESVQTEADRVFAMRMLRLLEAGYSQSQSEELAERFDVDLHEAEELIKAVLESNGDSKMAFRILI